MSYEHRKGTKFDAERRALYVQLTAEHGKLVAKHARACGVVAQTVDRHMRETEGFAEAVAEAYDEFRMKLQRELHRRAFEGVLEPVYQGGVLVGHKRKFSDRLFELALKRHLPEFNEKSTVKHEHEGGAIVGALVIPAASVVPYDPNAEAEPACVTGDNGSANGKHNGNGKANGKHNGNGKAKKNGRL